LAQHLVYEENKKLASYCKHEIIVWKLGNPLSQN